MKKDVFGEGAERYAFRFFELAADGATVVGGPLVAKESRFLVEENLGSERSRKEFVQTFCSTQQLAKRIAAEFNAKLDSMSRVDNSTPRVAFLDCSIYHLTDNNLGELSVLVEPCLNHLEWKKWNSNNGVRNLLHFTRGVQHCGLSHACFALDISRRTVCGRHGRKISQSKRRRLEEGRAAAGEHDFGHGCWESITRT
jgi:hypothetical protein